MALAILLAVSVAGNGQTFVCSDTDTVRITPQGFYLYTDSIFIPHTAVHHFRLGEDLVIFCKNMMVFRYKACKRREE